MGLLVAPVIRIWVTPNLHEGNGEGDTGRSKAPFHPPSDGANAERSEACALLNPAAPRANGARDGHQAKPTWRRCKGNRASTETGLVLFPSSLPEQWVLVRYFCKSVSSSDK